MYLPPVQNQHQMGKKRDLNVKPEMMKVLKDKVGTCLRRYRCRKELSKYYSIKSGIISNNWHLGPFKKTKKQRRKEKEKMSSIQQKK